MLGCIPASTIRGLSAALHFRRLPWSLISVPPGSVTRFDPSWRRPSLPWTPVPLLLKHGSDRCTNDRRANRRLGDGSRWLSPAPEGYNGRGLFLSAPDCGSLP